MPAAAKIEDDMITDILGKFKTSLSMFPSNIKRVAVAEIKWDKEDTRINIESLTDQINAILIDSGKFQVIERTALKRLLEEQNLSLTGLVDAEKMVSAGKLISIQGFFYGSIEHKGKSIELTLKAVDVETSASIYAKKFEGESLSLGKIGLDITGSSRSHSASLAVGSSAVLAAGSGVFAIPNGSTNGVGADLTYKQGMGVFLIGLDLGGELFFTKSKYIGTNTTPVTLPDLSTYNEIYSVEYSYGLDWAVELKPKLYLSSKALFGGKSDFINPYVGLSVAFGNQSGSLMVASGTSTDMGTEAKEWSCFVVAPLFGVEIDFTESISLFVEGKVISQTTPRASTTSLANTAVRWSGSMPGEIAWKGGFKWYFIHF
jgi:hypothetical protein